MLVQVATNNALLAVSEAYFDLLPDATRPIEVLQPIQALAQARTDYFAAVLAYDRAQFRLYRAIGQAPHLPGPPSPAVPEAGVTPVPAPNGRARIATSSDADPGQLGSSRTITVPR